MDIKTAEHLSELYDCYQDLGEDLLMLAAVIQAENIPLPDGCSAACLRRIADYIEQHTNTIRILSQISVGASAHYFPRIAEK